MNDDNIVLCDTQVYTVKRVKDLALIGVEYTRKNANKLLKQYEEQWDEECYIAPAWIDRPETIKQRNENGETQ